VNKNNHSTEESAYMNGTTHKEASEDFESYLSKTNDESYHSAMLPGEIDEHNKVFELTIQSLI